MVLYNELSQGRFLRTIDTPNYWYCDFVNWSPPERQRASWQRPQRRTCYV